MLLTQELNEKLLGNRLYANIFWQASEEIDIDTNNMDLKIIINGKEIKNPVEHLERVNSLIENFDEEVDKAAKELIKEKYEDLYNESMVLSRKNRRVTK